MAMIISDECQSFTLFNYAGISWSGYPYPVVAAVNIFNQSGTANVNLQGGVHNLTNGCSAMLRAKKHCLDNVKPAPFLGNSSVDIIECPSNIKIASVATVFIRQEQITVHDCFVSGPTTSIASQEIASVSLNKHSRGMGRESTWERRRTRERD